MQQSTAADDAGTQVPAAEDVCAGVARVLAGLLAPGATVAMAWRDARSGECRHGGHGAGQALIGAALNAVVSDATPPSMVERWQGGDGNVYALICQLGTVTPDQAWLAQARVVVEGTFAFSRLTGEVEELERSRRLQRALYEIADLAGNTLDIDQTLQRIHQVVGTLMYADNFYIVEYDADEASMRFVYFVDSHDSFTPDANRRYVHAELPGSLTFALIAHGSPLQGPSRRLAAELGLQDAQTRGTDSDDWLGVPLLRDGRVAGAIVVQSYDPRIGFSDQDRALLSFVAQHVQTSLDRRMASVRLAARVERRTAELQRANLQLQEEIAERRRAERLQLALFRISELAMAAEGLPQFYAEVHAVVGELLDARNFYIALIGEDGETLEFVHSVDEHTGSRPPRRQGRGLTEYVIRHRSALLANRDQLDALVAAGEVVPGASVGAESWLGVPLLIDEDVVGAVAVQSYHAGVRYTADDQRLLAFAGHHIGTGLARQRSQQQLRLAHADLEHRVQVRTRELAQLNEQLIGQIAERLRAEQRLTHQTLHDSLTGLPNRAHLLDALRETITRASSEGTRFAVLFLDLDRFKLVNDSVGHAAGDRMLVDVAQRIVATVRAEDMVARLGGDEFAILVRGADGDADALELARRLQLVLGQPMWVAGRELFPSASIGVVFWNARYARGEDLLRDADAAMHRAKIQGPERFAVFDEAMREQAMRSLDLEADIRRALNSRDFRPFYQPIVRLSDGVVIGHEALLRWHHESRGLLRPDVFIGLGEDSGLIEAVDWQLYEQVVTQLARGGHGYVSVNVSPRHFRSVDFAERLLRLLDAAGADPSRLRIEITEGALLDDEPRTLAILNRLRGRGVLIQLDDFGTGYSALSYLHRFPISMLKIDRSFVMQMHQEEGQDSLPLVRSILALAAALDIETVGEGIETERQLQTLRELGCHYGQGYLLGTPAPAMAGAVIGGLEPVAVA